MRAAPIIAASMLAAGAYVLYRREQGGEIGQTAGDETSNFIFDGADIVTGTLAGWPPRSDPYRSMIESAAAAHGVPVLILAWMLWKESRYNPAIIDGRIRSSDGAMGIAQFMPPTALEQLGSVDAALNPAVAIPGAARYLKKLYNATGSWEKALASYNWGIGNLTRKGLAAAPAETRDYYKTIMERAGGAVLA